MRATGTSCNNVFLGVDHDGTASVDWIARENIPLQTKAFAWGNIRFNSVGNSSILVPELCPTSSSMTRSEEASYLVSAD